jgi:hypothetical protein
VCVCVCVNVCVNVCLRMFNVLLFQFKTNFGSEILSDLLITKTRILTMANQQHLFYSDICSTYSKMSFLVEIKFITEDYN